METTVEVVEHSQVAEVRRVVAELARKHGMPQADMARAALVATEAASNLVKYGKKGVTAVSWFEEQGAEGIQIIAADKGPGFANFNTSLRDGHSTSGSLGIGLGAIVRNANVFDYYSIESAGAVLFTRVCVGGRVPKPHPRQLVMGGRATPKTGETESGDGYGHVDAGRWQRVCLIDGLGHGILAATAAAEAIRSFKACRDSDTASAVLMKAHEALKHTRGAVMAVAVIDIETGNVSFSGIGNIIAATLHADQIQHMASSPGIVGFNVRGMREQNYTWKPGSTLIMSSDGLSTRWNLAKSPGLLLKHPALIAAVMHRDFARGTDDATVIVAKELA
jgi:anti-sigma regulatory factor (Ser/Thr protein kinase)